MKHEETGLTNDNIYIYIISCRIGAVKFVGQWALICLALQPYVGSRLQAACQCLQRLCLYQAFWDRDWAGMVG